MLFQHIFKNKKVKKGITKWIIPILINKDILPINYEIFAPE